MYLNIFFCFVGTLHRFTIIKLDGKNTICVCMWELLAFLMFAVLYVYAQSAKKINHRTNPTYKYR